jgi:hypothetical protein
LWQIAKGKISSVWDVIRLDPRRMITKRIDSKPEGSRTIGILGLR